MGLCSGLHQKEVTCIDQGRDDYCVSILRVDGDVHLEALGTEKAETIE